MHTYLYGLVLTRNAHVIPAHIQGIGGHTLRVLLCGNLGALVSALDRPVAKALEDVRAHDHAMQSVVHHGATAAAGRFGQTFHDASEVQAHVNSHGRRIARVLEEWDGCVEMRVLVQTDASSLERDGRAAFTPGSGSPGRDYLEALKGRRDRLRAATLREAIGPVVRGEKIEQLPRGRGIAYSHLIDREMESQYRAALTSLQPLRGAPVIGPLPFYSFADPANEPA